MIKDQKGTLEKSLEEKVEGGKFSVDRPIIDLPIRGHVVLKKVEETVDVEWAEEKDLILIANVNLIGIVEVIGLLFNITVVKHGVSGSWINQMGNT